MSSRTYVQVAQDESRFTTSGPLYVKERREENDEPTDIDGWMDGWVGGWID